MEDSYEATQAKRATAALPGTVRPTTPVEQINNRLSEMRCRVLDIAARARSNADVLIGEQPETALEAGRPTSVPDVGGGVGHTLAQITEVEAALDEAWRQVNRLTVLAE